MSTVFIVFVFTAIFFACEQWPYYGHRISRAFSFSCMLLAAALCAQRLDQGRVLVALAYGACFILNGLAVLRDTARIRRAREIEQLKNLY